MIDYETLDEIADEARDIRRLQFPELSSRYVPGEGNGDNPEAFIIGEAPGADEDIVRRPFVGRTGKIQRQLMEIAGLYSVPQKFGTDPNCWLTNAVKFRPPRNAKPSDGMIRAYRHLLLAEWQAVGAPRVVVCVGGTALFAVTGRKLSILRTAGKPHYYASQRTGHGKPTMIIWPMVHPSFGVRAGPEVQALLEQDWERFAEWRLKNVFHSR